MRGERGPITYSLAAFDGPASPVERLPQSKTYGARPVDAT
jgi:hypothetical protein